MIAINPEGTELNFDIEEYDKISCVKGGRAFTRNNYEVIECSVYEFKVLIRFVFNPVHENKVVSFL